MSTKPNQARAHETREQAENSKLGTNNSKIPKQARGRDKTQGWEGTRLRAGSYPGIPCF